MAEPSTTPNPCLMVIFGASGDLTQRKLIPSLYELHRHGQLPKCFAVVGISRTKMSDADFRNHLKDWTRKFSSDFDEQAWQSFSHRVHYHPADATKGEDYPSIKQRLAELAKEHQTGQNLLFYLSVAPHLYERIITQVGAHHMITEGKSWCSLDRENPPWQRIIVEKPFGYDLESGNELNRALGRVFEEESIYRIDHYLGKDTVQNLLVFRFANSIFEPIWNRNYIDQIQITAAETVGVEGRGDYYDSPSGGAMRDMVQSHLMQLLALVAMEPPVSMNADDIRMEKWKAIKAVRPLTNENIDQQVVRGQYSAGAVGEKQVPDYQKEKGVSENTRTETYAAMQLFLDTWRWQGVPFYLRSGKAMPQKLTEIVVYFKPTPQTLFRDQAREGLTPNQIVINVQPDEGIRLRFEGKVPGTKMNIKSVVMDFDYCEQFDARPPEAYRTLLLDAMSGDQTLFKHREEIEGAWRVVQPALDYWASHSDQPLPTYPAGTWGPIEADQMMQGQQRHWHNPQPLKKCEGTSQ